MRQPTTFAAMLAPHRAAMAGAVNYGDGPFCGWFRMREIKGGPFVPVRIFIDREVDRHGELTGDECLACEVAGERRDPEQIWARIKWPPVSRASFEALTAARKGDEMLEATHAPVDLAASPTRPG